MSAVVHVKVKDQLSPEDNEQQRVVVLAVDDSVTSDHAFQYTKKHVLKPEDHLRVIHVQPFHEVEDVAVGAFAAIPIYSAGKVDQQSLAVVRKYAKLCSDEGISNFKEDIILEDGSAGAAICKYVKELPQTASNNILLVLGSRELGFFGRAFLGSCSDYCVKHCHCPVTVVKMPPKPKS